MTSGQVATIYLCRIAGLWIGVFIFNRVSLEAAQSIIFFLFMLWLWLCMGEDY